MNMKLYELITHCGAVIQQGTLSILEREYYITWCPKACAYCGRQHGLETVRSIKKIEIRG